MGLSVKVGLLSSLLKGNDRDAESLQYELGQVNKELKARGLPQHDEPINLSGIESRSSCVGYPYSFWRILQRFVARLADDPEWVPTPLKDDEDPTYDQAVIDQSLELKSHLLCHSPSEGYYLPIDFGEVIFSETPDISGGMLGSSYALMRELVAIAPQLEISLIDGKLSDEQAQILNEIDCEADSFAIEKIVWLSLFEAARLSIEHKTAICFAPSQPVEYQAEGFEVLTKDLRYMAKYLLDDQEGFLPFAAVVNAVGELAYVMLEDSSSCDDINAYLNASVASLRTLVVEEKCTAVGICVDTKISDELNVPVDALHCTLEHSNGTVQNIVIPYKVRETGEYTLKPSYEIDDQTNFNVFGTDFAPDRD